MVALNVRSRSVTADVVEAMTSASGYGAERLISKVFANQVQHLFNYGMNACEDQALVKNCIVELFLLIGSRPGLLQNGSSVDTNVFKIFRGLLVQQIASAGKTSASDTSKNLFSAQRSMMQGLTNLQREVLFLKFQSRLSYRDVAGVMDLTIEQLRSQISKATDILLQK